MYSARMMTLAWPPSMPSVRSENWPIWMSPAISMRSYSFCVKVPEITPCSVRQTSSSSFGLSNAASTRMVTGASSVRVT